MNERRLTLLAIALSSTLTAGVAYSQAQTAPPAEKGAREDCRERDAERAGPQVRQHRGRSRRGRGGDGPARREPFGSADVKGFAARVVSDHQKAGDELKSIAEAKGATPPAELSKKDQADLDKLSKLQGSDFDKAYIKTQLSAHKSAVALFGTESKSGKDAQLKQFASTTLPTLEDHLQMVQQLSKTTKS